VIWNDDGLEVFVTEHVLLEVRHGERLSAVTQFGIDWDGPTATVLHPAVFQPLCDPRSDGDVRARMAALEEELAARVAALSNRERVVMAVALWSRDAWARVRGVPLLCWYSLALDVCVWVWWWWR
jgi:hypothetical protein